MSTEDSNGSSSQTTTDTETSRRRQWSYDVFLSFRGEDTRTSFVDHLYTTLHEKGIHAFRDDIELRRGKFISPELHNAIEKSRFAVVIFSQNYANSSWCLEELTKIVDCTKHRGQTLMPVFYSVDPSVVRKQKGSYEEAFAEHEKNFEQKKIKEWRDALKEAANISGYDVQHMEDGHESRCIRKIAVAILNKLGHVRPKIAENLIGIEPQVQNLISLLNTNSETDVRIIGIWGMGGIGKSTIARAVFDQLQEMFEGGCFLDNVREAASKFGLQALVEKLLSETLKETKDNLYTSTNLLMNRLSYKKVMIVLDDVDQDEQIENLIAGGHKGFGPGSRIIITTRNKQLLSACGVDQVYEVSLLGTNEALMLFNRFAFKEAQPQDHFMELALRVVKCAWGLPLALKVLGCFLHKREKEEWESELTRLEGIPHDDVIGKLKLSIDALNDLDKQILLDIACFFKGKRREPVIKKFHAFGFKPEIGIPVLVQRSLLSISDDRFQMHDLVQETSWYMVRQGQTKEKYSRLWIPDDICDVMSKKSGTEAIEAIILTYPQKEKLNLSSRALKGMENLRLLKIRNAYFNRGPSYLPNELQWLNWHKFPSTSLPQDFEGEKLVGLKLSRGQISQLWPEPKNLEQLKYLNLNYSYGLTTTPDFSMMPNLEKLNLSNCKNLVVVHESIGTLERLKYLNMSHCSKLSRLPNTIHLESLENFLLWDCTKLENFPQVIGLMPNLSELHLEGTAIKELPDSLINISGLVSINLSNCKSLENITYSICGLKCLRSLNFSGCSKLESLPETLGQLETLEEVLVDGTAITKLPSTISKMGNLKILSFSGCKNIKKEDTSFGVASLSMFTSMTNIMNLMNRSDAERKKPQAARPSLSGLRYLKKLDLSDSDLVDEVAADVWHLASLEELNLSRNNFVQFPSRISGLPGFKVLKLEECKNLEVLPDLPLSIAVIEANDCPALHTLGNLSTRHAFLRKVSFANCHRLHEQSKKTGICAADLLLELLLQGHSIIYGRFSILIAGGKFPGWFDHQKIGGSISVQLPSDWQDNIVGIAVCFVLDSFIPKSKLGVTFKLVSPDHREYTSDTAPSAASKMGEVYDSDHVWITYISFNLFRLLFPDFTTEDWTKVCGSLSIRARQDPWTKVRRCGIQLVYKQDLSTLAAERAGVNKDSVGSKELVVYEGGGKERKEEAAIKEDIAALMAGVTELNWDVDPIEQDTTQLMNLRKSIAYKIQKTLSFEC